MTDATGIPEDFAALLQYVDDVAAVRLHVCMSLPLPVW